MLRRLCVAVVVTLMAGQALADRIDFANGDVMTGTITSMAGGKVVIRTDYAGRVTVDADKIARIATDGDLSLRTKGGEALQSAVEGDAGAVQLKALDREIALADISKASRESAAEALSATDWSHKLDLAAVLTSGNTDTSSFSILTESLARSLKNEHLLTVGVFQDEADSVTTKEQFDVNYGYKRFLENPKWFLGANAQYFRDTLLGVDPRVIVGGGAGYRFWDNSLGSLTVEAGLSAVYEDLGAEDATNPALRWALNYRRLLAGEKLEFFHRHQLLKILDTDRGEVIDSSTGLAFLFNDWWSASLRADLRHQTKPPVGSKKTDMTYAVGVGVRF
ncbi:MAG: DUF481 domain-containing protein [Pseudomonadales bacterium]|nr:DUF481 domain-containing protein [Pseudomonadales bacterium]